MKAAAALSDRRLRWQRIEWAALATTIFVLVVWLSGTAHFSRTNAILQDITSGLSPPSASPDIVIIAIDDASIATIGRWPWRRALHAQLLEQISAHGPRAIGMDVLFNEEDLDYPGDDLLLARAIARSGRVVLPIVRSNHAGPDPTDLPFAALMQNAAALGHAQVLVSSDGVARSFHAYQGPPGHISPHLTLAMECLANPAELHCRPPSAAELASTPPDDTDSDVAWQSHRSEIIRFAHPMTPFTRYSYIDVLRGAVPPGALRGKHVLIGATATGLGPGFSPPSGTGLRQLPHVEMLAHVLNGTLQNLHLETASHWANRVFNALPVLLALVGLTVLGPSSALAVCAGLLGLTLLATGLAPLLGLQFAPAAALAALLLIYPLWSWRRLNAAAHFLGLEMQDLQQQGLPIMQPAGRTHGDFLARRISAVEHASRELRKLHRFVSESLSQLPSATFVCDDQGQVLLANALARQYVASLGHQEQAASGQNLPALLCGLLDRDTGLPLLAPDQLRPGAQPLHVEGDDRQGRSLLLMCKPATTGWIITLVDMTATRQALAERDQAMHFISHDIRAPVGAIITLLEMQRGQPDPVTPALMERIERYARSSLTLADDFVHLARARHQPLRQERVDLAWVLEQAIDDSWAQACAHGMQLTVAPRAQHALLQGDSSLLRRAVVNVIGNAIKYGRPAVAEAGAFPAIECALEARPGAWALSVRDHGPGIPVDQQGQLFQAFERLQHQHNTNGVGLGLAFVHAVITRHGGQIEVLSAEGAGTTFTLVLPALETAAA